MLDRIKTPSTEPESGRATLASVLARRIRESILNGTHAPGEKLRLEELRDTHGVSLSPLREALSRLGAEGLVLMEDQRGYRVAPVSAQNLRELTALRVNLETMALREAMRQGDDTWEASVVAAYHRLVRLEERALPREEIPEWEARHREFHMTLLSACAMPLLIQFCETLHDFSNRYRRLFLARYPLDRDIRGEHRDIMEAAIGRRGDDAAELLTRHIGRTGANILPLLERETEAHMAGSQLSRNK
jgi:DNA-binding GntR family transcriptional regulator